MASSQLIEQIKQAGLVGAGGAGFPTHVKVDCKVDWVIVNAAECEPLLHADASCLEQETDAVIKGVQAVVEHVGAERASIAIKRKHADLIALLKKALGGTGIEIAELEDTYPAGDEHVVVYEVTGRVVPESGLPLHTGCLVSNVETFRNIAFALEDQPVTHKYVTVNGAVAEPKTFRAPVGISLAELIQAAGGPTLEEYTIVTGGCMMGKIGGPEDPLTKTMNAVLVFPPDHRVVAKTRLSIETAFAQGSAACCQCWDCTKVCPRYLLGHTIRPHLTMRAMAYGKIEETEAFTTAYLCSECGTCEMYCPLRLSPRRVYQYLKAKLREGGVQNPHHNADLQPRTERQWRQVPTSRLRARLDVERYDVPAPLDEAAPATREVVLPLKMHVGAPAEPIVQPGDAVSVGQQVARIPEGALGAAVHASIAGKVVSVDGAIVIEA